MSESLKKPALHAARIIIALVPWVVAMYAFYWLDSSGTWTSETPHRGKISVILLGTGMTFSFLIGSQFMKQARKQR